MLDKLKNSSQFEQVKQQAKLVASRMANHHVSLAVTGLSKSGKTAFITSLINQLLEARHSASLPFFTVASENRIVGVRRDSQPNVTVSRFAYEEGIENLSATPPQWPESTNGISQVRLLIKYQNQSGFRRLLSEQSTLTLDITDYPGEWLLDLPLLDMNFQQWCEHFWLDLNSPNKSALGKDFLTQVTQLDLNSRADDMTVKQIAETFAAYLTECKAQGYQLIQPGRFVLPGELSGAPVLHFFPIQNKPASDDSGIPKANDDNYYAILERRFEDYKNYVVKPFYEKHFKRFDRQIILVDCLGALNQGAHSFDDLNKAIEWLLGSFHYGSSNILKRLFAPKIDKLLFAASKADHVTPDQQDNLVKLLESIVHQARQHIQFEGVATESTAIASIKASESGMSQFEGKELQVIKGINVEGNEVTLYPGDVPAECPVASFWQHQGFAFPNFAPPTTATNRALPHIRMDQVLQFILADKLS
jgi:predicted YcjX-like family ATPase